VNGAPSLAMTDDELQHVESVIALGNRTAARLTIATRAERHRQARRRTVMLDAGTYQPGQAVTRVA
jgi:hypothetical protein